jgi:hypothetical protein
MKMTNPSSMANTNVNGGSLPGQTEYIVHSEGKCFVSQCLNVDVSRVTRQRRHGIEKVFCGFQPATCNLQPATVFTQEPPCPKHS